MRPLAVLLAHQGGWDEMLFVLLPVALFAGLLSMANKKATRIQSERAAHPDGSDGASTPTGDDAPGGDPDPGQG